MYRLAEKTFYTLSAVVLGSAFFVIQPSPNMEVSYFQNEVKHEFSIATTQVLGDEPLQPMIESVEFVTSSVNEFYMRSADAMIALLTPTSSQDDVIFVAQSVYSKFAIIIDQGIPVATPQVLGIEISQSYMTMPSNFMQEESLSNIVPTYSEPVSALTPESQAFVGSVVNYTAVNDNTNPWVNLRDNMTGQIYCVGIYNSEVNRYLGPCKNDYH